MIYLSKENLRIPEEVWQAWKGAYVITRPPLPIPLFPLTSSTAEKRAHHFQATKAGHGLQALMFILASPPPSSFCLAFFCVHPGTTSSPLLPPLENKAIGGGGYLSLTWVREWPLLKPLTHRQPSFISSTSSILSSMFLLSSSSYLAVLHRFCMDTHTCKSQEECLNYLLHFELQHMGYFLVNDTVLIMQTTTLTVNTVNIKSHLVFLLAFVAF